jgi:hypothetical protein
MTVVVAVAHQCMIGVHLHLQRRALVVLLF